MKKIKLKFLLIIGILIASIVTILSFCVINQTNLFLNNQINKKNIDSPNFLQKIETESVKKLNNKEYIGYTLNSDPVLASQNVSIENNNIIYDPFRLLSLKKQTNAVASKVNIDVINDFWNKCNLILDDINSYAVIEGFTPFLEASSNLEFSDKHRHFGDVHCFIYSYTANSMYGTSGESEQIKESVNDIYQNQMGYSYDKFCIHAMTYKCSDIPITVEFPAGYKQSEMFIPYDATDPNEKGEFTFKVGSAGSNWDSNSNTIILGPKESQGFRAGFIVHAKYLPKISIDPQTFKLNNEIYNISVSKPYDIRYSYLSVKNKNSWNTLKDYADFLSYRENKINEIKNLINDPKYFPYINQCINSQSNLASNQIMEQSNLVSNVYKIKQYKYLVPDQIQNTYVNYNVTNNSIKNIRYYSNINNFIADQIILDPESGVKNRNKNNISVYNETDYENLALRFKFDDDFLNLLNLIDEYNNLLLTVKKKLNNLTDNEIKLFLYPLWNFEYDIKSFENLDKLINELQNNSWKVDNTIIPKMKEIFQENYIINDDNLYFFHDLPELFKEIYEQLKIEALVSQADQEPTKISIFENKSFNSINFNNEILLQNKNLTSQNIAKLKISDLMLKNKIFTSENTESIELSKISRKYPICNSINVGSNFIEYNIKYRKNFQQINPINDINTKFKINLNIDKQGFLASDYIDNSANLDDKFFYIERTIKDNLCGATSTVNFQKNNIQILSGTSTEISDLNKIINTYGIDLKPNDFTGTFYVLVSINNSNDLINFGNENFPEIIPNNMWFINQSIIDPSIRTYLFKLEAAKKLISLDDIDFKIENKKLCMRIKNDQIQETINLNFQKDDLNNLLLNQVIFFSLSPSIAINDINDSQKYNNLIERLENALTNLNFVVFKQNININFYTNEINFQISSYTDLKIDIIETNLNKIELNYSTNDNYENKYSISYQIIENNNSLLLSLNTSTHITESAYKIYIMPFENEIINFLINSINKNEILVSKNLEITNLKINFLDLSNEMEVKAKSKTSSSNLNDSVPIILGITIPIILACLILIPLSFWLYKKRKIKLKKIR